MRIRENLSVITVIYGVLALISFWVAWVFHERSHHPFVVLIPVCFGVIFLLGGARNLLRKPDREARWEAFTRDVWAEVVPPHGKVTWPDRKTIYGSTIVVIVSVLLISLYIAIIDAVSSLSIRSISEFIRRIIGE